MVSPPETKVSFLEGVQALDKVYLQFGVAGQFRDARVLGVSSAGLVLASQEHLTPGTQVELRFSASRGTDPIVRMQATVVYCLNGRIAVHFTNVRLSKHVETLAQIQQLITHGRG